MEPLIQAEQLCKIYNRNHPDELQALAEVSFTVNQGEVVVLKGPSGSGKTSLLSLIGCMARPTSGRLRLSGKDITRLPERFLAGIRRESFGFIFQQFNLLRDLSVCDNILLPLYPSELKNSEMMERADEVLQRLDMSSKKHKKVHQLSGGEQQRVAIARALINHPQIIIADEPTAHLDSKLAVELLSILKTLKVAGKTIIIATHDPAVYQHPLIDRGYLLDHGSLQEADAL
jgi:putative ABC transport system ATP-binding protein